MRLIDADLLLEKYDAEHEGEPGRARQLIEEAPTVQPDPEWIPCSERLPEENEYVLLCNRELEPDEETGYSRMAVGWLEDGKFCCWDDRVARKEFVAWMPLLKPYKEGEQK